MITAVKDTKKKCHPVVRLRSCGFGLLYSGNRCSAFSYVMFIVDNLCVICKHGLESCVVSDCGHKFCRVCLEQWEQTGCKVCAICRMNSKFQSPFVLVSQRRLNYVCGIFS
jgi:hypothetical protein